MTEKQFEVVAAIGEIAFGFSILALIGDWSWRGLAAWSLCLVAGVCLAATAK